jgi:hypothetical protein
LPAQAFRSTGGGTDAPAKHEQQQRPAGHLISLTEFEQAGPIGIVVLLRLIGI